jgi:hypothetical protein
MPASAVSPRSAGKLLHVGWAKQARTHAGGATGKREHAIGPGMSGAGLYPRGHVLKAVIAVHSNSRVITTTKAKRALPKKRPLMPWSGITRLVGDRVQHRVMSPTTGGSS